MSLDPALYEYLSTHPGVTALVADRIFPVIAHQGAATPHIIYQRIGGARPQQLRAPVGVINPLYQFTVAVDTSDADDAPAKAHECAEALRNAMDGFRGDMGAVDVRDVRLDSGPRDSFVPFGDGDEGGKFTTSQDYSIWHTEAVPTF